MVSRDLYPFESHHLGLNGINLHYLDEGSGDPIVMVHGNPTWSFYYRNLVSGLRSKYRTIVPDHIGCGLSDKPSDERYPYTLDRRARDLEALLDHLGLQENLTLVLHDWGGMIGMLFASRYPERIKRLIILNTSAFHLPTSKTLPRSLALIRNTPLGPFLVRGLNAFCLGAIATCVRKKMSPEVKRGYLAPYDSWDHRIAVLRFVQTIPLRPTDEGYDLVTEVQAGLDRFQSVPMLICWGMHDFVFDTHFLDEWRRAFPNAEFHQFANAGHYVLEDAGDEILPLIENFLVAHPLSAESR